jgi:hypothetical protein
MVFIFGARNRVPGGSHGYQVTTPDGRITIQPVLLAAHFDYFPICPAGCAMRVGGNSQLLKMPDAAAALAPTCTMWMLAMGRYPGWLVLALLLGSSPDGVGVAAFFFLIFAASWLCNPKPDQAFADALLRSVVGSAPGADLEMGGGAKRAAPVVVRAHPVTNQGQQPGLQTNLLSG